MDNTALSIILGIAANFVGFGIILIFQKIILPWYQNIIYSGIDISGEWESSLNVRIRAETAILNIKQNAKKVTCLMTISISHSEENVEIKTYELKGEFEDRFISLQGKNINNQHIGFNVMLLELVKGGSEMMGKEIWFGVTQNKINSANIAWRRSQHHDDEIETKDI